MPYLQLEEMRPSEPVPGFVGRFIHSENMTVAEWRIQEGSDMPEHAHPHEQIALILEGKFELTLHGTKQILEPGTVAIIPSNVPHQGRALTTCRLLDMFYPVREDLREASDKE
jgi:quercetin dioxygenase-like cupin family protein